MATIRFAAFALLASASLGLAASEFEDLYARQSQANPQGLSLAISTEKPSFRIGERIPVKLAFANTSKTPYQVRTGTGDRCGRILDIRFCLDGPADGHCDPLGTFFTGVIYGGGFGGVTDIGEYAQEFDLNEWVRIDTPGEYRLFVCTSRVQTLDKPHRHVGLCSPILELTLAPADAAFVAKTVQEALLDLRTKDNAQRLRGARALRFLATHEAVDAITPYLDDRGLGWEPLFGVIGARDWPDAARTLSARLDDPDVAVGPTYLRAPAHVSVPPAEYTAWSRPDAAQREKALRAKQGEAETLALKRLAEALPRKRGRALAIACALLLERKSEVPRLRASLASAFLDLAPAEQEGFLVDRWEMIRCPEMEAALGSILAADPHGDKAGDRASAALARLTELNPGKAGPLILEDLRRPKPRFSAKALCSLPDESLPELDDTLLAHCLDKRADLFALAPLVERYATPRILPKIIELYRTAEGRWAYDIQESFLRFWVKHDRKAGLAAVERAARLRAQTRCYTRVLASVLGPSYGPDAEALALSFLGDPEPDVALNVVSLLAAKGTPACIDPLLARLGVLDPQDETIPPGAFSSVANLRQQIVGCLLESTRWELSEAQRQALKKQIKTAFGLARFRRRFEPGAPRD